MREQTSVPPSSGCGWKVIVVERDYHKALGNVDNKLPGTVGAPLGCAPFACPPLHPQTTPISLREGLPKIPPVLDKLERNDSESFRTYLHQAQVLGEDLIHTSAPKEEVRTVKL
ncbi:hypothetical protein J6590_012196 [Homalodisca vitripennis]|nr:hypothetical protein J6590_012196 [Homalodisca vitripennis]